MRIVWKVTGKTSKAQQYAERRPFTFASSSKGAIRNVALFAGCDEREFKAEKHHRLSWAD